MHNLLHLVFHTKQCEFAFYTSRVNYLMGVTLTPMNIIEVFFCYFGWYFILVFVMQTGYGLVCKHERNGGELRVWPYLRHNFYKLFVLLAPGFLLYLMFNDKPVEWSSVVYQLTMTINLFAPDKISPGVYWYIGLTMQFYIVYLLFHHFRSRRWIVVVSVLSLVLATVLLGAPIDVHERIRHNSPVWLPVMLMGVWMARYPHPTAFETFIMRHWGWSVVVLTVLWIWSAIWGYLWPLSPLLAVMAIVVASQGIASLTFSRCHVLHSSFQAAGRCLSFIGGISAGIYVCHPIVRIFAIKAVIAHVNIHLVVVLYLLLSIITGFFYTALYKWCMSKDR